jgi:hypothetical protein
VSHPRFGTAFRSGRRPEAQHLVDTPPQFALRATSRRPRRRTIIAAMRSADTPAGRTKQPRRDSAPTDTTPTAPGQRQRRHRPGSTPPRARMRVSTPAHGGALLVAKPSTGRGHSRWAAKDATPPSSGQVRTGRADGRQGDRELAEVGLSKALERAATRLPGSAHPTAR